jgi:hypothetical protein
MRSRWTLSLTLLLSLTPAVRGKVVAVDPPTVNTVVPLVPSVYRHRLVQQLSLAEDHQQAWLDAIAACPAEQREGLAFLLVNMPESDLKSLDGDLVLKNVALAYGARAASPWAAGIPNELFLRDVLPYANVDEKREDWRSDFVTRFAPLVKDCKSASDAAQVLNKAVFPALKVRYHATKREKPNQSPAESTTIGYASCTGLSIILVDACRAVGVPARVAGTPLWADKSGNHTWVEVWDGQWHFVGAAEPGPLDQTWFVDNAAQADRARPETHIFAAEFAGAPDTYFPLVWDEKQRDVKADDVTGFYKLRRKLTVTGTPGAPVEVRLAGKLVAAGPAPAAFELAAGTTYAVSAPGGPAKDVELPTAADVSVAMP